jgi:hypothetical protein
VNGWIETVLFAPTAIESVTPNFDAFSGVFIAHGMLYMTEVGAVLGKSKRFQKTLHLERSVRLQRVHLRRQLTTELMAVGASAIQCTQLLTAATQLDEDRVRRVEMASLYTTSKAWSLEGKIYLEETDILEALKSKLTEFSKNYEGADATGQEMRLWQRTAKVVDITTTALQNADGTPAGGMSRNFHFAIAPGSQMPPANVTWKMGCDALIKKLSYACTCVIWSHSGLPTHYTDDFFPTIKGTVVVVDPEFDGPGEGAVKFKRWVAVDHTLRRVVGGPFPNHFYPKLAFKAFEEGYVKVAYTDAELASALVPAVAQTDSADADVDVDDADFGSGGGGVRGGSTSTTATSTTVPLSSGIAVKSKMDTTSSTSNVPSRSAVLTQFLLGTCDSTSPLSTLSGYANVLELIWLHALDGFAADLVIGDGRSFSIVCTVPTTPSRYEDLAFPACADRYCNMMHCYSFV